MSYFFEQLAIVLDLKPGDEGNIGQIVIIRNNPIMTTGEMVGVFPCLFDFLEALYK
jgi:hypothetical protein